MRQASENLKVGTNAQQASSHMRKSGAVGQKVHMLGKPDFEKTLMPLNVSEDIKIDLTREQTLICRYVLSEKPLPSF